MKHRTFRRLQRPFECIRARDDEGAKRLKLTIWIELQLPSKAHQLYIQANPSEAIKRPLKKT
jgi:hypothetical protein